MLPVILLLTIVLGSALACTEKAREEGGAPCTLLDCVDPFIGTGGGGFSQGNAFPGPTLPFGMVQPGPDTHGGPLGRLGFAHTAGYWYPDSKIEGFSQIHLYGTGIAEGGYITLMPTLGFSREKTRLYGYAERFSHKEEQAEPGYYRVKLENGIVVELTATLRVAYHRYHYPRLSPEYPVVILDLSHALGTGAVTRGTVTILDQERLSGTIHTLGEFARGYGGFPLSFAAKVSPPFQTALFWSYNAGTSTRPSPEPVPFCSGTNFCMAEAFPRSFTQSGDTFGIALLFSPSVTQVEIRVGISYVDETGAQGNLEQEGNLEFEEAKRRAKESWEALLSRVEVQGGSLSQRRKFYTALYHCFMMPNLMSDRDRRYRGVDGVVRTLPEGEYYSNFSLWDTYRTLHSLLNLIAPEYQRDFLRSLVLMGEALGFYPRWPLASGETGTMVGIPAHIVMSEGFQKGVSGFEGERAYARLVSDIFEPPRDREVLAAYGRYGYVPDRFGGSVALTLEYAHALFALSRLAAFLGKEEESQAYLSLARGYRKLYDPATGVFRPRDESGNFRSPFDPGGFSDAYVEGDAWHYLYMAPWDAGAYPELFGSQEKALSAWERYFSRAMTEPTPTLFLKGVAIEFPRTYYWPMNEPSLYAPLFGSFLGKLEASHKVIRWVQEQFFRHTPEGIPGNDDGGTMSAWYVFSALGFFPIPGSTAYILTGSTFPRIILKGSGWTLEITHPGDPSLAGSTPELASTPLSSLMVQHGELLRGRHLRF